MIDHVTFAVPEHRLKQSPNDYLGAFFHILGATEIEPEEEAPWGIRWWMFPDTDVKLHITAAPQFVEPELGLAHFAIAVEPERYARCRKSIYCVRAREGSERIWLRCYGIRVEVREHDQGS